MVEISDREIQELRSKAIRWALAMHRQHGKNALRRLDSVIASHRTEPYARLAALATRPELVALQNKRKEERPSGALVLYRPKGLGLTRLADHIRRALVAAGALTRRES